MMNPFKKSPEFSNEPITAPEPQVQNSAISSQASRLIALCKDFDGTVRSALGDEVADNYAREQREVASKVHRLPPDNLDDARF